jgi:hypothetical protein
MQNWIKYIHFSLKCNISEAQSIYLVFMYLMMLLIFQVIVKW